VKTKLFGKGFMKIVGLAVGGAIALAAGAELLSSVVSIVLAFRFGNAMPLIIVVILTVGLILVTNHIPEETPSRTILKILSYAATCYLAVIAFVIALPYGLVMSIIAAGAVGVLSSTLGDQKMLFSQIKRSLESQNRANRLTARSIPIGDGQSFRLNKFHTIMLLESGVREKVVQLMKERPLLAISLTHYEECDALFVTEAEDPSKFDRVMKLLGDYDIVTRGFASALLAEAIQLVPILDSKNGLKFDDYRYTRDSQTIDTLLEQAPVRMTVFPSPQGLGVVVPDMEAPGMEVERLKHGHEANVLLHRNYSYLEEVDKQIESTA
jgi:hypothetical protein